MTTGETAPAGSMSVAIRAAGIVIAAGYLFGLSPGPLVSVIGALALVTFGRALSIDPEGSLRSGIALAIVAAALGVGALRWGTLDLGELRGVQSVLGPSLLVGPWQAAVACGSAAAAALIALSAWMREPAPAGRAEWIWTGAETALWSLAILSVFFVPARSVVLGAGAGSAALEIGRWVLAAALTGGIAFGLSLAQARLTPKLRVAALAGAAGLVAVAAVLVAGVL